MTITCLCVGGPLSEESGPASSAWLAVSEEVTSRSTDRADDADDVGDEGGEVQEESISVTGVWTEREKTSSRSSITPRRTGIDITYEPRDTEAILTGTLIDYEAGVATADVVVMPSPARVQSDAESGHLASLTDTWDPEEFARSGVRSVDGEAYAAPFKMDLKPGFWYRSSFSTITASEPDDYDQFLDLLAEIDGIEGVEAPLASGTVTAGR